jgi:hypothetical protein
MSLYLLRLGRDFERELSEAARCANMPKVDLILRAVAYYLVLLRQKKPGG